jgi:hypothetical protein
VIKRHFTHVAVFLKPRISIPVPEKQAQVEGYSSGELVGSVRAVCQSHEK